VGGIEPEARISFKPFSNGELVNHPRDSKANFGERAGFIHRNRLGLDGLFSPLANQRENWVEFLGGVDNRLIRKRLWR
jgi:hypothetical protein